MTQAAKPTLELDPFSAHAAVRIAAVGGAVGDGLAGGQNAEGMPALAA